MGQLDNSCVYINKVGAFGVKVLVDPHCGLRGKGNPPSLGKLPDRYAPICRRPGVASHYSKGTHSHPPHLLLSHCARVFLLVQEKRGIPRGVARYGNGVLQLPAGPHGEKGWLASGLATGEDTGRQRRR